MLILVATEDAPPETDRRIVEQGLIDHAAQCGIEPRNYRILTVLARDVDGNVVGGLVGATVWGWLQVRELWVAEPHRRKGLGTELIETGEREARARGCHHVFLDTFDFQAREFYAGHGYEVFGSLADFPRGHVRLFMRKALASIKSPT